MALSIISVEKCHTFLGTAWTNAELENIKIWYEKQKQIGQCQR
jgi:hypothetical protein